MCTSQRVEPSGRRARALHLARDVVRVRVDGQHLTATGSSSSSVTVNARVAGGNVERAVVLELQQHREPASARGR